MFEAKQSEILEPKSSIIQQGGVVRLYPEDNYGFLETQDGELVYFTSYCVEGRQFDKLSIGTQVYFEFMSEVKGLQAKNVLISL